MVEKQIRSLKIQFGSIGGKHHLIVYLAINIGRETVNIDISKKGLPIWQGVCILDQKSGDQTVASLMND